MPSSYQTDITNLHKKFYYIFNISKIFQLIEFNNIKYQNVLIDTFAFKKNIIVLKSNLVSLKGSVIPKTNYSTFFLNEVKINDYTLKDVVGKISYEDNIILSSEFRFQDFKYDLNATLKKDILNATLHSKNSQIRYAKILLKNSNLNTKLTYSLSTGHFTAFVTSNETKIYKDKNIIFSKNPQIKITNKKAEFHLKNTNINSPLLKLYTNETNGTYFFNSYLFARISKTKATYKDTTAKISFADVTYKDLKNLNVVAKKIDVINSIKAKSGFCKVIVFDSFRYAKCDKDLVKFDMLSFITDTVELINNELKTSTIKGKYKNIPLKFEGVKLNIDKKTLNIQNVFVDKIKISNIKANTKDFITYNASFQTNARLDYNLKKVLKEFNITIPITQIRGSNDVKTALSYNTKTKALDLNATVSSVKPAFKYQDITVYFKKIDANYYHALEKADFKASNMYVNKSPLLLSTSFKGIFFKDKYLNIFARLHELKVLNLLNITDYDEKIAVDLKKKIFYLINLAIMGDYANNRFYFYSFKPVLKYTPFSGILDNGSAVINVYKDSAKLLLTLFLKKPLILNNKPQPNSLFAIMDISKKGLVIHNNYAYVNLPNYEKLDATIKNAEINVNMVIDIIHTVTPLISTSKPKKKDSKPFTAKVIGTNTHFIYDKHKFLSDKFTITYDKELKIKSRYKKSRLEGYTKHKYFLLSGENYTKKELVPLLDFFNHFESINLDFVLVKSPEDFYSGKVYINSGIVKDLKALNNLIAFLNTIPSLLSLKSPGFSAKGYKIKKGYVDYLYYKNILYFKKIQIKGINLDFDGKGYIDFNTNTISLKLTSYMKMNVKNIPIIGKGLSYLLFGKDGSITVKVVVSGPLDDPKVTQDLGKSVIMSPFELFKRVITLPFNLF